LRCRGPEGRKQGEEGQIDEGQWEQLERETGMPGRGRRGRKRNEGESSQESETSRLLTFMRLRGTGNRGRPKLGERDKKKRN